MKFEGRIPILDGKNSKDSLKADKIYSTIASNALRTMTESLVKMESKDSHKDMMEKCVWPILYEAARRFETIADGDLDVPVDGFEFVVG